MLLAMGELLNAWRRMDMKRAMTAALALTMLAGSVAMADSGRDSPKTQDRRGHVNERHDSKSRDHDRRGRDDHKDWGKDRRNDHRRDDDKRWDHRRDGRMGVMGVMMITGGAIGVVGETMTVTGIIGAVGAMTTIVGIGITTGMIGTGMIGTIVGTGTMTTGTTMDVGTGWGSITGRGGIAREGGTAASACPLPTTRGLTGFMTMGGAAYAGRRMGIIGCGWITMPFSR